ncbi:MAG: Crp/Fnr family transcriptional regulator [Candidatus Puniceispirillaceae bacterium]
MMERDKYILWDAGEVIYRAGDPSTEAFLIMDGSVQVFTNEGLLLNRIGVNEILGETSLLLDTTRTVTAIASSVGAKATRIPRQYFADLAARDRVAAALIRKSQYRLIDSNKQSNMLGLEIDKLGDLVERVISNEDDDANAVTELRSSLAAIRKQVVFDRHLAHYPNTDGPTKADEENAENFG